MCKFADMKTSFYFLLWMLIYWVIDLLPIHNAGEYSFIIAFVLVYLLSMALSRMMPHTIAYDRTVSTAGLLEDVYQGNVSAFRRRLGRQAVVETVSAIYFAVTIVVLVWVIFNTGQYDIFAIIIFAFLAFGAIGQSSRLIKANSELISNPTGEQCARIAIDTYRLDYAGFYEAHQGRKIEEMLPPRPRHYYIFLIFSLLVAATTTLFGLYFLYSSVIVFLNVYGTISATAAAAAMYFLYGSLATYFGIRDCISTFTALRHYKKY